MNIRPILAHGLVADLVLSVSPLVAGAEPAAKVPPLLSHDELQKRLGEAKLRLLDVRPKAEYDKGHIPGALWVDGKAFQDVSRPESFADPAAWAQVLAPLGIGSDFEVYLYDDARQHDAARLWWFLSYAGVDRVGLVNGGFALWERQGRPVSSEVPAVEPRRVDVHLHAKRVAGRADVQAAIAKGDVQLLDARSAAEYRGETRPRNGGPVGHIPSARSLEGYDLVDAEGRFLDAETQRARLAKAGIAADRPVIVYSQGGARSALAVFALKRLGIPARHYFPGLSDWSKVPSAPFILGADPSERAR
jgi:thiosulfate/3-mercaptopyruvate sulfurtransferase